MHATGPAPRAARGASRVVVALIVPAVSVPTQDREFVGGGQRAGFFGAARGVRHADEQRDNNPIREQRRAAVREEGQGQAGQRDDARHPADDDEALQPEHKGEPGGEEFAEAVARFQGDPHAAADEEQVDAQDGAHAHQPEFLGEGCVNEIGMRRVHQVRVAAPEPRAEKPAGGHTEEALHYLVGAADGVIKFGVEGVEPDGEARLHVGNRGGNEPHAAHGEDPADGQPGDLLGGHPQHRHEEPEEQQCGAEIAFKNEHAHAQRPGDEHREDMAGFGQANPQDFRAGQRQVIAFGHEVGREEHRETDFRDLRRLEGHPAHRDPQA